MRSTLIAPLVALVLGTVTLPAQDTLRVRDTLRADAPGMKSPGAARVIGILPGAGHIYAGETGRGFAFMGGVLGAFVIGSTVLLAECYSSVLGGDDCASSGTENVIAAAILGLWGWSIYDAGRAAHRTNARRRMGVSLLVAPARQSYAGARAARGVKL